MGLDDQYFINSFINTENPTWIVLDTKQELCQTIVNDFATKKDAATYHFPGPWADIGWSRIYNTMVGEFASSDLIPIIQTIPTTLISKILKPEYYSITLFVFQLCTFWLSSSVLFLGKVDSRTLISLALVVWYVLHTYQTYT